jgi:hypothetical protein
MEAMPKKPVWKKWWFWVLVFFFIIIVSAASDVSNDTPTDTSVGASESVTPIVDGPHILGLTIEQVREELGAPDEDEFIDPSKEQLALGVNSWTNQWTINDHTIVLDFDVASRQVTGFFISMNQKEGVTRNWQTLMKLGGLSENAQGYSIKPIEARKDPGYYTGVQATE